MEQVFSYYFFSLNFVGWTLEALAGSAEILDTKLADPNMSFCLFVISIACILYYNNGLYKAPWANL